MADESRGRAPRVRPSDTDAVLAACRVLIGLSVRGFVAVEDRVNLVQLRILTVVASREGIGLSDLAQATGLHVSRASRGCDRLVAAGLLVRHDDPSDRRSLRLALTAAGRKVVADVAAARRRAVTPVLQRMTPEQRAALVDALAAFAESAGQPADTDLWSVGWATSPTEPGRRN